MEAIEKSNAGVPFFYWRGKHIKWIDKHVECGKWFYPNKCVECGKWFYPREVDHSSEFWRRSDGVSYSHYAYCSVECVGRADCNWRMGYADHIRHDDFDEENGRYEQ